MFTNRIRLVGLVCFCALVIVWGRVAHLQLALGPWYRVMLSENEVRTRLIPAPRGTIRAADGTELARDRCDADLAVHYRYLERPLDEAWLTRQARGRLTRRERRDPTRVEQEKDYLRSEIETVWYRVAELTGTSTEELDVRARVVQRRVERVVESVNRRRHERWEEERRKAAREQQESNERRPLEPDSTDAVFSSDSDSVPRASARSWWRRLCDWLADSPAPTLGEPLPVAVQEQQRYYCLVEDISPQALLEFTTSPELFPGVRLEQRIRRVYPECKLASSVVGYIEPTRSAQNGNDQTVLTSGQGRTGVEGFYDDQLRGVPGRVCEQSLVSGGAPRVLGGRPPQPGHDVTLTVDRRLQRFAEETLEHAIERGEELADTPNHCTSGAIVVLDVWTGAVLVAAGAPCFDLNTAARPSSLEAQDLASQTNSPLFNRVVQMTLPPGSTFKPVTAVAAIKKGIDPRETFVCRGYLHEPDKFRCLIYRHFGVGHEAVNMTDAIVRSCNVYFFHLSEKIAGEEIVRWGQAFGFGRRTGIDLAGEEPGILPATGPANRRGMARWSEGEIKGLAIGQGTLSATPLQVAVMMATIANGGMRVVPHVRRDAFQPPRSIEGFDAYSDRALAIVRRALELVVADPRGTGHEHVFLPEIEIAGKTGTAQSGSPLGDHAWFAGYLPAKKPQFAIVAVLEHAGSGGHSAGPLVRVLVRKMLELGYCSTLDAPAVRDAAESAGTRR